MAVTEAPVGFDPSLSHDFKSLTVRGGIWTLSAEAVKFVLVLGATIVLSRLLTPQDFGLYAVVMGVANFLLLFRDLGLGISAVQATRLSQAQASALFWINIGTGMVLATVMLVAAPLVSWVYHQPRLTAAMWTMALCYLAMGLSNQPQTLLRRRLRLDIVTRAQIIATGSGCVAAVIAAWLGARYWALIVMSVVTEAVLSGIMWVACDWRPDPPSRFAGMRPLLTFGGHMTGFNVLRYVTSQFDSLLVGWYWGPTALGFYDKADKILQLPNNQVGAPVANLAYATLSRLNDQPRQYFAYLRQYLLLSTGVGMPVIAFLFVTAHLVIPLVLGAQWSPSVLVFRALAPSGFFLTFTIVLGWLFVSEGRTGRQLAWQVGTTILTVASFFVGLPWGPFGVALVFSVSRGLLVLPNTIYCCHGSPVRWTQLVNVAAYPALASLLSAALTWIVATAWLRGVPALAVLLAEALVFWLCYVACWLALPSGRQTLATYVDALKELRPA
jgi:O-antigen/teichoic acid export membrane protein